MPIFASLAETLQVTQFDIGIFFMMLIATLVLYYFISLHRIFEAAFGAIIWLGIYVLLSILLIGNPLIWSEWGLFPMGFSVFLVSIAVYLVFVLAILFPLHGGLVITEPTQPTLYTLLYFIVSIFLLFALGAVMIYMIEQSYIFRVGNIFTWIGSTDAYITGVKPSWYYSYVMSHQYLIIPLGVVLMLYKLLFSNLINAALLSIWYNLANVGFYRSKEDSHYRVEFHEVGSGGGWHGWWAHDDHASHDDGHAGGHDKWGHH
jgi:hypothetical protein